MKPIKRLLKHIFGEVITKPSESPNASRLLINTVWLLRIFIYLFGLYQLFKGETIIGLMIVICVLFLVAPSLFTGSRITDIPLELEFFLFVIVFFQFVVGEAQGFYGKILFYDNIMHFLFPFLISVMGFTIAYALYFSGKLKVSTTAMIFYVILITLGIGAFWEIIEYSSDTYLYPRIENWHWFQGTDPQNANKDTMEDLYHDFWGGVGGAVVASRYILEARYNKRLKELFKEIIWSFFRTRVRK